MPNKEMKKVDNYELVLYRLDELKDKLDAITLNYVTKDEFESFRDEVRRDMTEVRRRSVIEKVLMSVVTATIVSLVWYVIVDIIKN